jgi:AcrR family transcriptional regulator
MMVDASRRGRGRPPKVKRPGGSSRQEFIDAAAEVFAERGYDAAPVDEVIRRAGLSKGTFYFNFASKADLFLAVVEDRIDRPARELMELTANAQPDAPTSERVSAGLADILRDESTVLLLLQEYASRATRDEALATRYRARQASLRGALAHALEERHRHTGVPLVYPAERLAEGFIGLAQGLALESIIDPEAIDSALFGDLIALVYDGLVARAASEPSQRPSAPASRSRSQTRAKKNDPTTT